MPTQNQQKEVERVTLDKSFLPTKTSQDNDFWIQKEKTKNEIKRLNIYHWVVHIIAFIVIIPFVIMVLFQQKIPESYSTIVSVVVGFYFARSLFRS